tara:strand:+ start:1019 stop:1162 length:144 start_codon:yes stop_codon:yes gene_type:complete
MPDVRWSTSPQINVEAARQAAKKSKDGRGLTALERAFYESYKKKPRK